MKRLVFGLLALPLVGCATFSAVPTTGQLLDAPTKLDFQGNTVTASSNSTLNDFDNSLNVEVLLKTYEQPLPKLKIKDVFMITNGGVWIAAYDKINQTQCYTHSDTCTMAVSSGSAQGLEQGEGAQVVVKLQDDSGETYLLRDQNVKVGEVITD